MKTDRHISATLCLTGPACPRQTAARSTTGGSCVRRKPAEQLVPWTKGWPTRGRQPRHPRRAPHERSHLDGRTGGAGGHLPGERLQPRGADDVRRSHRRLHGKGRPDPRRPRRLRPRVRHRASAELAPLPRGGPADARGRVLLDHDGRARRDADNPVRRHPGRARLRHRGGCRPTRGEIPRERGGARRGGAEGLPAAHGHPRPVEPVQPAGHDPFHQRGRRASQMARSSQPAGGAQRSGRTSTHTLVWPMSSMRKSSTRRTGLRRRGGLHVLRLDPVTTAPSTTSTWANETARLVARPGADEAAEGDRVAVVVAPHHAVPLGITEPRRGSGVHRARRRGLHDELAPVETGGLRRIDHHGIMFGAHRLAHCSRPPAPPETHE